MTHLTPVVEMDCFCCFSSHFDRQVHPLRRFPDHLQALNALRLKRLKPQGRCLGGIAASSRDQTPTSFFFLLHLLALFHSTPFHFSFFSLCSVSIYASESSPSFSSAIVYMYIYKSAHNWCQGKSKEQWGREAIRGIKRGAASQPSFTGQWSKSNWVLFCSRTHVFTHTHTHTYSVTVVEAHS